MFLRLPPAGGQPRQISEVVNNILDGKINSVNSLTLATGNATSTTLYDARISEDSLILFYPLSAAAIADAVPYGAFQDSTDQSAASTTSAYAVTFNTTDYSAGISVVSNSQITVRSSGVYNIQLQRKLYVVNP